MKGRFGALTPEQDRYLLAMASASLLAPRGGWAEKKLAHVLEEEANRYGVALPTILMAEPALVDLEAVED